MVEQRLPVGAVVQLDGQPQRRRPAHARPEHARPGLLARELLRRRRLADVLEQRVRHLAVLELRVCGCRVQAVPDVLIR